MSFNYKVTIITVCFKSVNLLEKTINSVLNQTFQNKEYIIVDGNSNDGTDEVVFSFGSRIDKYISEPDSGIYDAMNKGIAQASGDYVIFLNAGDHFTCEFSLESLMKGVIDDVDVFFGKIVWIDTYNKEVVTSEHDFVKYEAQLKTENFPHPATLYRRQSFEKYGPFSMDFPILADYEWNLRALIKFKAKFRYLNTIVSNFYTGGVSTSPESFGKKIFERNSLESLYFSRISNQNRNTKNRFTKFFCKPSLTKLNRV